MAETWPLVQTTCACGHFRRAHGTIFEQVHEKTGACLTTGCACPVFRPAPSPPGEPAGEPTRCEHATTRQFGDVVRCDECGDVVRVLASTPANGWNGLASPAPVAGGLTTSGAWGENLEMRSATLVPAPAVAPVAGAGEWAVGDYRDAVSGDGPLAAQWADKPHRLVYDLCTQVATLTASLASMQRELEEARKPQPCSVCGGRPLASGRKCVCDRRDGWPGTEQGEMHGLRVELIETRDQLTDAESRVATMEQERERLRADLDCANDQIASIAAALGLDEDDDTPLLHVIEQQRQRLRDLPQYVPGIEHFKGGKTEPTMIRLDSTDFPKYVKHADLLASLSQPTRKPSNG